MYQKICDQKCLTHNLETVAFSCDATKEEVSQLFLCPKCLVEKKYSNVITRQELPEFIMHMKKKICQSSSIQLDRRLKQFQQVKEKLENYKTQLDSSFTKSITIIQSQMEVLSKKHDDVQNQIFQSLQSNEFDNIVNYLKQHQQLNVEFIKDEELIKNEDDSKIFYLIQQYMMEIAESPLNKSLMDNLNNLILQQNNQLEQQNYERKSIKINELISASMNQQEFSHQSNNERQSFKKSFRILDIQDTNSFKSSNDWLESSQEMEKEIPNIVIKEQPDILSNMQINNIVIRIKIQA